MAGRDALARHRKLDGWPLSPPADRQNQRQMDAAGRRGDLVAGMAQPVRAGAAADTREQWLPAHPAVQALLPGPGLRRGSTVAVTGSASLLYAILGPAMRDGRWAAVIGRPDLGLVAAAEHDGVDLARLALIPHPASTGRK